MTDFELIKVILAGEKEKFRIFIERHQQMVYRTCMGFVHNKEDADDLTQEVFIRAFQSLSGFKGESAVSTWLYRIAVNASLNKIRKDSKNFIIRGFEILFGGDKEREKIVLTPDYEDPEKILIRQEYSLWLQRALDSLPERQRTAIVLSKYDDLSQKEIAKIMNLSEGAVEALLQRAKTNLRKKLVSSTKKKS